MKMQWQGRDRVHLRAGTQAVMVTGRYLFLGKREACGSVCTYPSRLVERNCACYAENEEIN